MPKTYAVYILANRARTLYTGVTSNLDYRTLQHRQATNTGFAKRYRIHRLVHFESFTHILDDIAREKEIKAWPRQKKIQLIESHNPTWQDLAAHLPTTYQKPQKQKTLKAEPPKADSKGGG